MSVAARVSPSAFEDGPTRPSPTYSIPARLASVDVYRGFVMFLMMAEVLHLAGVAKAHPEVKLWQHLAHHQEHVAWVGCTLHDMIQPSFSFLVGVALPFSIASRLGRGQSKGRLAAHAFWRALVLAALGIFLRSRGRSLTNFTFEDTLTQIGLGYGFLFLLGLRSVKVQIVAFVLIVVGYWAAFTCYTPPAGFSAATVGVPADFEGNAVGLAAHWNKNANLAWKADTWFLNLFPREKPFLYNGGGYATLSFIPTLATMVLGLLAGGILRKELPAWQKVAILLAAGVVALGTGWGLGVSGLCPVVKRIWTPSWVLYSGGWCFIMLATFYTVVDLARLRPAFFPFMVIGMNSIAAYVLSGTFEGFVDSSFNTHQGLLLNTPLGRQLAALPPPGYGSLIHNALVLFVLWLVLLWMYRRGIFLKV